MNTCPKCGAPVKEINAEIDGRVIEGEAWHRCHSAKAKALGEKMYRGYLRAYYKAYVRFLPEELIARRAVGLARINQLTSNQ